MAVDHKGWPFHRIALAIFIAVASLVMLATWVLTSRIAQNRLIDDAEFHLDRLSTSLDNILAKHIYLPKVLAEQASLKDFLANINAWDHASRVAMSRYLARINNLAQTSDIYLMQPDGVTVAASNHDRGYSFVGKDFSFRPYFTQAMQGRLGRYYALGTTSQERGYYFASAVRHHNMIVGVVVVKLAIREIERSWNSDLVDFMVTDPDGIVFISNRDNWQFHALQPLTDAQLQQLDKNQRYSALPIKPLDMRIEPVSADRSLARHDGQTYLMVDKQVDSADWKLHILIDRKDSLSYILMSLASAFLATSLTAALIFMLLQRQRERRNYEARERELLEKKVEERTRELKMAQEELVQAAKMAALGQLSAGVNHELNNPLAAIRSYADNAIQFLQSGQQQIVENNLLKISDLTERMAAITHQLKSFSRKSRGRIEPVNVQRTLDSTLTMLKPQLGKLAVQVIRNTVQEQVEVMANQVWLEQILVNLLKNAIDTFEYDSLQEPGQREITIKVEPLADNVTIHIEDNGKGIDGDQLEEIFEPFFTTRSSGKGLGLGLSISYRLARDMNGNLTATNASQGGALFSLTLPRGQSTG